MLLLDITWREVCFYVSCEVRVQLLHKNIESLVHIDLFVLFVISILASYLLIFSVGCFTDLQNPSAKANTKSSVIPAEMLHSIYIWRSMSHLCGCFPLAAARNGLSPAQLSPTPSSISELTLFCSPPRDISILLIVKEQMSSMLT